MSKTIVYCADGTWNGSGVDNLVEHDTKSRTNVLRIFDRLSGLAPVVSHRGGVLRQQTKVLKDATGTVTQIAMYCHGVGENQRNWEEKAVGGVLGGGLTTRLRQGYVFISQEYDGPEDTIIIVGFSRGSYTARALADLIATRGLLKKEYVNDGNHLAFSWAAGAWLDYRLSPAHQREGQPASSVLDRVMQLFPEAHHTLLKGLHKLPAADQYVPNVKVAAVAVFDTVGAMGIPEDQMGRRLDGFDFVSSELKENIGRAIHAVSLDEQRYDFAPTLWRVRDPRLTQTLFPGAHADVGGGYPEDHGLSDVTLEWMTDHLRDLVRFDSENYNGFKPDALALAHRPWFGNHHYRHSARLRNFSEDVLFLTKSRAVAARMDALTVPLEADERTLSRIVHARKPPPIREQYAPPNLPAKVLSET